MSQSPTSGLSKSYKRTKTPKDVLRELLDEDEQKVKKIYR